MSEEVKKERKRPEIVKYPAEPSCTASIDMAYIKAYLKEHYENGDISKEELVGWQNMLSTLIDAHGERAFFGKFRKEFVKAYFPKLDEQAEKTSRKRESLADFIGNLLNS